MIHEKLDEKLQEWKIHCVNFINIVTQIQSTKDSCLNFFETNNDVQSRDVILQMNFECLQYFPLVSSLTFITVLYIMLW